MTLTITVRKAELADLSQIAAVDNEAFGAASYGLIVLRQFFDIAGNFFFVAENEAIVGYACGAISCGSAAGIGDGWILSLAVSAMAQRMGVGEKLAVRLMDELTQAGANKILLTVEKEKPGAQNLYLKLGFAAYKIEPDYFGTSEDRLVMQFLPK
jgi:[ribosomal protein S18]-alanine N-acetyltransferase